MKIFRKHFLYLLCIAAAAALLAVLLPPGHGPLGYIIYVFAFVVFGFILSWIIERDILKDFSRISKALEHLPEKQKKARKTGRKVSGFDTGVSISISELSERISLQMQSAEREGNQLKSIIESMWEGVIIISREEELLLLNDTAKEMFAIDDAAIGRPYMETVRNPDLQALISRMQRKKKSAAQEISVLYPQERSYLVSVRVSPRYREIVVVIFDITEFKNLERIKADFVANVSHELRTPLTSIKGYIETLLDKSYDTNAEKKKFLEIIEENTDRLIAIASDLLVLSELESGETDTQDSRKGYEEIDIRETILRSVGSLNSLFSKNRVNLSLEIEDGMPPYRANRFLMERMLINLVENSAKYTPADGSVSVRASAQNGSLRIEIEDSGIGIPPEHHERIFERFYRVDKNRSREIGGTGLGLSIVKHIVIQHGGTIALRSTEGEGSTFTVELPHRDQ
ncbi:MAG: PAS domain-containing protein [Candidatus Dadabacteria bacterium]|nr:PAS domain-containing protein [Candidatus Dadabacteria bacterium]MYA48557.1 PAS domain-containing protein [Candidatus Dadabacteria bacterium]MYG83392.1 PAS domain-containing protein [Candidatus Dadabacteria bacterium]MYK49369.1 PAS domain-containing protein [Candidatus Dadabacteria bacterium]